MDINKEVYTDGYYHLRKDIESYPSCWLYVVFSRRGPGKTYSALRMCTADKIKFIYIKRTNDDVEFICSGNNRLDIDPSPFVPLNRDFNINIIAKQIHKGFGGFYNSDPEGNPTGAPIGYIISLNAVKSIKGFDLSDCDMIIFDEFIPQPGEIVKLKEGEMLLDLYMTISRDRLERGRDPLKLVLFANAEEISTPITNTLELTDIIASMKGSHVYDQDREILIHHITDDEIPIKSVVKKGIYKGMEGTAWFDKSFGGEFSNNDFSNIRDMSLKNMQPMIKITYNRHDYYIYYHPAKAIYYMTTSKANTPYTYDLSRENDQKLFYKDFYLTLRFALAESRFYFKFYTMYDLINRYKKYFVI